MPPAKGCKPNNPNCRANLMRRIQKGEVRNPRGSSQRVRLRKMMRDLLGELADSDDPTAGTKGEKLIKRWLDFGMRNHNALRDIVEQLEGKPKQEIEAEVNDSDSKEMRDALKLLSNSAVEEFANALRAVREKGASK